MAIIIWIGKFFFAIIIILLIKWVFEIIVDHFTINRYLILMANGFLKQIRCRIHKEDKAYCVHLAWRLLTAIRLGKSCVNGDERFLRIVKQCVNLGNEPLYEAVVEIISFGRLEENSLGKWSFKFPESEEIVVENYGAKTKGKVLRIEKISQEGDKRYTNLILSRGYWKI